MAMPVGSLEVMSEVYKASHPPLLQGWVDVGGDGRLRWHVSVMATLNTSGNSIGRDPSTDHEHPRFSHVFHGKGGFHRIHCQHERCACTGLRHGRLYC
ncbi:uncharacterized protein EKO05_0010740 [Ascochyta rabiei]|uniref:uncharacterized protein n=1 Tax=Didymella rabiei TaxID=5454 RepID=UPI0022039E61|nr:uncharacterized protein EKO05_0010740 [Ascochyta rabiei]UPX20511.1 hypothetical protein EKO05_0010740 [Ascochyta rabiei]